MSRGFQEHVTKILYALHVTGFDALSDDETKGVETAGEEMIYAILYLENSDKSRFSDLNKRVEND